MDDVEVRVGDLTQPLATRGICEGIDVVFHLASHAHALDENDAEGAASHRLVTAQGARLLLQDAVSHGVKCLVFLSSVKAMGEGGSDPQAEADPPRPASPYGEAKLAAERVLLEGSEGRIATTVLRLPMVYGPGCKGNLPRLIDAIARGRFPPWPRLDNRRSSVHVTDVVRAALTVACDPRAAGQVYLLCEDRDYSTRWLYEQISLALGRRPPSWSVPYGVLRLAARAASLLERLGGRKLPFNEEVLEKLAGDARYSSEKIRSELGFATVYSLETELPLMVRDYLGERQAPPGSSEPGAAHAAEGTGAGVALPRR
jgi:nucleoside-diphosphate-sugar epimerase